MQLTLLFLCTLFLGIQSLHCQNTRYKIRTIAFYNVENLFDTINDPETFDDDFTGKGKNRYTAKVYWEKIDKISSVISQIGKEKAHTAPALIGLAEIENRSVLEDLVRSENLRRHQYQIIHFDSPDRRGIDVAFLYREKYFIPTGHEKFEVKLWEASGERIYTRDILLVSGLLDNEQIHILINHWPSRRGGLVKSGPKREKAAYISQQIIHQIKGEDKHAKVIIMGDFNDDPNDKSIKQGLNTIGNQQQLVVNSFFNPMEQMYKKGLNTLGYRDGLNLFDQILLSYDCIALDKNYQTFKFYRAGIFNPPFIITAKGRYKGYPYRSFEYNRYTGGYSDHFPVYIYLIRKDNPLP